MEPDRPFLEILNQAPLLVVQLDAGGRIVFINDYLLECTGWGRDEVTGRNWFDLFLGEEIREKTVALFRESLAAGNLFPRYEIPIRARDGRERTIRWSNTALRDGRGTVVGTASIGEDVTELREAEARQDAQVSRFRRHQDVLLRLSADESVAAGDPEKAFPLITESVAEALEVERVSIWLLSADGRELRCADLYTQSARAHSSGAVLQSGNYPRYFQAFEAGQAIDAHDARSDPRTSEFAEGYLVPLGIASMLDAAIWLRGRIAGVVCHEHVGRPRRWHPEDAVFAGTIAHLVAAVLMSAEREQAAAELRESQRALASVIGNLPGMVYRCRNDKDRTMEFLSDRCAELTGYGPRDLVGNRGLSYHDLIHPEDREGLWDAVQEAVRESRPYQLEYRIVTAAGREKRVWEQGSAVTGPGGGIAALEGYITDVTERRRAEEALAKAQRLESVGVLAGGIAHDFNNLLTAILGNISLARMGLAPSEKARPLLEEAERASLRARDLTRQLLTFSRGGVPLRRVASVAGLVAESAAFGLRGSSSRCEFDIPGDLWPAEVDEGQISQVIHNLVINADQAMPGGGTVSVRCENVPSGSAGVPGLPPGEYVKITVADRGVGIPSENLSKIFDPFFSTKQKGSGLGLAIAYSIIRKHDGIISAEPRPGGGAAFHVYLPAARGRECEPPREEEVLPSYRGRILVMDDEAAVREVTEEILRTLGYEAVLVRDGSEALALYRAGLASGAPFDAVILDLTVPGGMGGKEAIRELRSLDPGVRAIVSSGYSNDPVMGNYSAYGFIGVIPKPYHPRQLGDLLRTVLAAPDRA